MVNVGNLRDLVRSTIIEIVAENISLQLERELTAEDMKDLFSWYEDIRDDEERSGYIACFTDWPIFDITFSGYALDHIPAEHSIIESMRNAEYEVEDFIDQLVNTAWKDFYKKFPIKENIYGIIEEARKRLGLEIISQKWRNSDELEYIDDVSLLFKLGENYYKVNYSRSSERENYITQRTPVLQVRPKKIEIEIYE